jgi:hypothetical protein
MVRFMTPPSTKVYLGPRFPYVSSENSDRFHSGNSEPSGDSRKG